VVPAAYFETFPEHISQLVLLSKVEKPLPSETYFEALQYRLQNVLLPHQQHPFAAPDAYFDSLAMRVQERLYEQKQAKPLLRELRPAFALRPIPLAAILLTILALGIGYTFYSPTETQEASLAGKTKVPMALEPVSTELAEVALSTELAHADESLLAEAADEQDAEAVHGLTDELHPRIIEGIFLHFAYTKIAAYADDSSLHHPCDENGAYVDEIPQLESPAQLVRQAVPKKALRSRPI
jgi:hypothetical protein